MQIKNKHTLASRTRDFQDAWLQPATPRLFERASHEPVLRKPAVRSKRVYINFSPKSWIRERIQPKHRLRYKRRSHVDVREDVARNYHGDHCANVSRDVNIYQFEKL